jgi:hypothetical protein
LPTLFFSPAMWQEDMRRDFTQGDSTLIYLAAHVLGRPIVIIPFLCRRSRNEN